MKRSKTFKIHDSLTIKKELAAGQSLFERDENQIMAYQNLRKITDKITGLHLLEDESFFNDPNNDQSYCPINEDIILLQIVITKILS